MAGAVRPTEIQKESGHDAWQIGHVTNGERTAELAPDLEIIEVESDAAGHLVQV